MTERPTRAEVSAINRVNANKRWAKHRAERIARGLPPTRSAERGYRPPYLDDPEVEEHWISEAHRLGLADRLSRIELRKLAKRLHDATSERRAATIGQPSDAAMLVDYWRAEHERWTRYSVSARRRVTITEAKANEARSRLGLILLESGDA